MLGLVLIETLRALLADEAGSRICGLDELVEMRSLLDRLEGRWLEAIQVVAVSGEVESTLGMSVSEWLADRGRVTRGESRQTVTLAQRLAATESIGREVVEGRLSLAQASLLVRARTKRTAALFDEHESLLVETAKSVSADQLQTLMSQWYRRADAATADAADGDVDDRRELFLSPVGTTEWALNGTLTAEQGTLVAEAINAIAQAEWEKSEEKRTLKQRRADSLTSLARFWLDHQDSVTVHGQRPHVQVIVDVDDVEVLIKHHCEAETETETETDVADTAGQSGPAPVGFTASTSAGMTLDPATVERIMCDCVISRIVLSDSVVLDVGRPSRTIPLGVRRAVIARDRHCRYPGCDRPAMWSDVHHVHEYNNGGGHSLTNCVLLCGRHHDRVHRLHERVTLDLDGTLHVVSPPAYRAASESTTRTSHPPPSPTRLFAVDRKAPEPFKRERKRAAARRALSLLRDAEAWTAADEAASVSVVRQLREAMALARAG